MAKEWALFSQFLQFVLKTTMKAKSRQRLLLLATLGLSLSSFSLLVLQATMGGLQHSMIERSKRFLGHAEISFPRRDQAQLKELLRYLTDRGHTPALEFEMELLLKNGTYMGPVLLHGVDQKGALPDFLRERDFEGILLGTDLMHKLRADFAQEVRLISPSHTSSVLGERPRDAGIHVSEMLVSDVPEVDLAHGWVRASFLQNLVRQRGFNLIRLYGGEDFEGLKVAIGDVFGPDYRLTTWEEKNAALVWSLNLENRVMIFLFIMMTFLVSLSITSGIMVFFNQIKFDLMSFWILGTPLKSLDKMCARSLNLMGLGAVSWGLLWGGVFLILIDRYSELIMPRIFIESKIPVHLTAQALLISFCIPLGIALLFTQLTLRNFRQNQDEFLATIRSVG